MNAILMVCYNNLEMTKEAIDSCFRQETKPLDIYIVNNGSTDGTEEWLKRIDYDNLPEGFRVNVLHIECNESPAKVCNSHLRIIFGSGYDQILCIPNDVILPENMLTELLKWPRGIVTASEVRSLPLHRVDESSAVSENTPFAVMLLRKWLYDAVISKDGFFFDERMWHYASDCDIALRIASCGIRGIQINVGYYHFGSASWKNATPEDRSRMLAQADMDREAFEQKWGFKVDALEYGQMARDINFKG